MMKFFRKYNKHLLAVFMALLLVIWLGGSALEQMFQPDPGKQVIGTAVTGKVTEGDRNLARVQTDLQRMVRLSWQEALRNPLAPPDEQLDFIDWILLQREAQRYGIEVNLDQAKTMLAGLGLPEAAVRQLAARRDVATRHIYEAAAQYFAVQRMIIMFQSALIIPEPQLRLLARNLYEQASIELVTFPAEAFADPDEKFTEDELQAHFDEYKAKKATGSGLGFGYFIEPHVKLQYIRIDPAKIKDHLRGSELAYAKRAFSFWKEHQASDPRFRRSPEEMEAARAAVADATTNGKSVTTNGEAATTNGEAATTKPAPVVSPVYETFAEARDKAIEAVKTEEAKVEGDRVATKLTQLLNEPWFDVPVGSSGYKPAPEVVKNPEYYAKVIAKLPANLQYPSGIEIGAVDWTSQQELSELDGIGSAAWELPEEKMLPLWRLAFNVEGLETIPEGVRVDRRLYLSLWQTLTRPLPGADGAVYLFRVIGAEGARAPTRLEEVVEQVVADMRTLRGMDRARAEAERFAENIGTGGLKAAWEENTALVERITPDRGGHSEPQPFPRNTSALVGIRNFVPGLGIVTDEFIEKAFELAEEGEASGAVVAELPDQAKVTVIKGKKMFPLYDEVYQLQRLSLRQQLAEYKVREIIFNWLNAKHVRERNQWTLGSGR